MGKLGRPGPTLDDYLHWQERLQERSANGLSVGEFCLDEGVSRSTFYRWVRRIQDGLPESVKGEGEAPTLVQSRKPKFLPVTLAASAVEIELPNGGSIKVPLGVGEAVLIKIIEVVGTFRPRLGRL